MSDNGAVQEGGEGKAADQWEDQRVVAVREHDEGWSFEQEEGGWLYVPAEHGVEPRVGDVARLYGKGFGYPVRGLDLNGVEVWYETEAEYRDRAKREQEARDAEKRATWEANRADMDAALAALPKVFQMRVCRFRHHNPDFGWEYEPYEMASCVDAVKIAEAMREDDDPRAALETFHKLPWDEQKRVVPDLSDGHSGNTFGMAVRLAHFYLTDPDLVWMEHAAISPLVGCECGCPPVKDKARERATYERLAAALATPTESAVENPEATP